MTPVAEILPQLRAVWAEPNSLAPVLALCDALEERGDPAGAHLRERATKLVAFAYYSQLVARLLVLEVVAAEADNSAWMARGWSVLARTPRKPTRRPGRSHDEAITTYVRDAARP